MECRGVVRAPSVALGGRSVRDGCKESFRGRRTLDDGGGVRPELRIGQHCAQALPQGCIGLDVVARQPVRQGLRQRRRRRDVDGEAERMCQRASLLVAQPSFHCRLPGCLLCGGRVGARAYASEDYGQCEDLRTTQARRGRQARVGAELEYETSETETATVSLAGSTLVQKTSKLVEARRL